VSYHTCSPALLRPIQRRRDHLSIPFTPPHIRDRHPRLIISRQQKRERATVAEDLQTASRIATRLTRIVGVREQSPAQTEAVTEQRLRVFALTMRAYDEVRAAVAFVRRREGDAEEITPNLYTGRGRSRAAPPDPTKDEPQKPAPSVDHIQGLPAVPPEAIAAAVAAQKGGPGSKDPFLS